MKTEESMKEMSFNRNSNHLRCIPNNCSFETDVYRVSSTGPTVTCDSCINLINKYCARLPGDK